MRKLCAGIVVVLLLTACGDGGPFEGLGLPGGGADTWEDRFSDLAAPDWERPVTVTAWDQERAFAIVDIDPGDRDGFAQATTSGPIAATIPEVLDPQTWMLDGFREGNGYDRTDVVWAVEVDSPPTVAATLGGDFDLAELEAVNGPAEDGTILSEDPMAPDLQGSVPGRRLGRQPHYHLDGDRLQVTRMQGAPTEGPRAIERSSVADLARVLDDLDAYGAYVVFDKEGMGRFLNFDAPLPDDLRASSTLPLPYMGVGLGFPEPDEDGLRAAMLFFHRAEEVAEANADALVAVLSDGEMLGSDTPWSEVVTDVEVVHDERVVVANVRLADDATQNTLLGQLRRAALVPSDAFDVPARP